MEPDELLSLIEKHLEKTGVTETRFGLDALGDPNFIPDLRGGREPRRSTVKRVVEHIATGSPRESRAA